MDYQMIDQVMLAKGLASDPAFDALVISIEPIPCFNGCPLGLYYPGTGAIVLPPDGTDAALLHELGHRHGHYYYNDLSETYAEDFRKIYQAKGKTLLYAGNNIEKLPKFGSLFEEGESGAVEVALLRPLTPDGLSQIKNQLYSYPESPRGVYYQDGKDPVLRIEFTKGVDWMVIIGATLAGFVALTIGIMGYAIYKVAETSPWVTPVTIIGTVSAIILALGLGVKYSSQLRTTWARVKAS